VKTVFLSSTCRDLVAYREAAIRAINALDGYHCVHMEAFGARAWESDEFCRHKVAEADLILSLVGHLHGTRVPGCDESYTEREYQAGAQ
jgi:Domain of unknown function (DUF4062)